MVRVLVFVNHDLAEAAMVCLCNPRMLLQHFYRQHDQVVEVEGVGLAKSLVVLLVSLSDHLRNGI